MVYTGLSLFIIRRANVYLVVCVLTRITLQYVHVYVHVYMLLFSLIVAFGIDSICGTLMGLFEHQCSL